MIIARVRTRAESIKRMRVKRAAPCREIQTMAISSESNRVAQSRPMRFSCLCKYQEEPIKWMRNVRGNERICCNRKSWRSRSYSASGVKEKATKSPPRLKLDHRRRSRPALDYQPVAFHYGGRRSNIIEDHTENVLVGSRLPHHADQTALSLFLLSFFFFTLSSHLFHLFKLSLYPRCFFLLFLERYISFGIR